MNRRSFLKNSTGLTFSTSAALSIWGSKQSWAGANDKVRVGVMGIRGMGFGHIRNYVELKNVEVVALCDIDKNLYPERVKWLLDNGHPRPELYVDVRKMLEDKNLDAISVATQNHWHALAGFWAAQAGKHSTLEKPATHNIFEGQQLIKASKKYKVLIQQHAERRSDPGFKTAMKFLHDGGLGEVYLAKGLCYKWRGSIGTYPDGPMKPGTVHYLDLSKKNSAPVYTKKYLSKINYDLWLGPAPKRPFNPNHFHYNWHWLWEYGNGDMGNQGAHQMDIARWGLGVTLPTEVDSIGGHFMFQDDQETPNTQIAVYEFPNPKAKGDKKKILQFEVRHWISNHEGGFGSGDSNNIGNIFYGSEGYMTVSLGGEWKTFMGPKREPGPSGGGRGNMWQNFVDSIRTNDRSKLEGDIVEGHHSCALIHLANISYRLGRRLKFDPINEKFIGDNEANKMLTRDYREPYIVTEKV
jgi:predicted dehydrogenase